MSDHPQPPKRPTSFGKGFWFALKAIEIRLRFILVLVGIGLVIGYWDTIQNHWDKWTRPAAGEIAALPADEEFYCPMHPNVTRNEPDPGGAVPKCPICGMPLSIRQKGGPVDLPEGILSRVQLSPYRLQLAGINTVEVTRRPLMRDLRAVGYVAIDESRLSRIVIRAAGYVEKLYVNESFTEVRAGEPLAEIYSPELYSAAQELLIARDGRNEPLVRLARERLTLLGVADAEIDEILRTDKAELRLVIRSPSSGHIFKKNIVEGDRVEAGQMLFEIADLSTVWIEGEVYEKDAAWIQSGQAVEATVEGIPGRVFQGHVGLVHPHVETSTRTLRVRCEIDNPDHLLLPGMFATLNFKTPLESIEPFRSRPDDAEGVLAVPERAVIDTGEQKIVYVEREPGVFDGVSVTLGPRVGGYYSVIDGIKAGDRIAASGAFLIDAETRLNPAASAAYFGASGGPTSDAPSPSKSTSKPAASADQSAQIEQNLAQLSESDHRLAEAQKFCPVTKLPLGSMGIPIKVAVNGREVFVCCEGCPAQLQADPEKYFRILDEMKQFPPTPSP